MSISAGRKRVRHKVLGLRNLNESTYILRFEKQGLHFEPGQYLNVGISGDINMREYSIYSPLGCEFLEILVKEVEGGQVSRDLRKLAPKDEIYVEGPFGYFLMDEQIRQKKIYFIGTGTGISPFHCFVGSYPEIDYTILHGVRYADDDFESEFYKPNRFIRCISREGENKERVSDYLRKNTIETESSVYLCGNCDMIYEVYDILIQRGIERSSIFAEVYF